MKFLGYEMKDYIAKALQDLKFNDFSNIQKEVFENLNSGKNIIARSKTGSGKTHSFLIPIFNDLDEDLNEVQALIIAPTKELSLQIYKVCQHIASFCGKEIVIRNYSSGTDRNKEIAKLDKKMPQIVIGTLGKIKDLAIDENVLKIYKAKYFVCDEADMTFSQDNFDTFNEVANVLSDAKFMFFSATFSDFNLQAIKKYVPNVVYINIEEENKNIKHIWIPLKHKERYDCLKDLLNTFSPYFCMIFCNKKEEVVDLAAKMSADGFFVGVLYGDLSARERKKVLNDCNKLKYQYLVCSDLAARGIDIEGVSHIINYTLPYDFEFYVHRAGRTGRMFNDGIVYSFYTDLDDRYLDNLAKKNIRPEYFELKDKELVEYKGRNTRALRQKPVSDYKKQAAKYVPLPKKVKPGYKKKRELKINEIATSLKKRDKKR